MQRAIFFFVLATVMVNFVAAGPVSGAICFASVTAAGAATVATAPAWAAAGAAAVVANPVGAGGAAAAGAELAAICWGIACNPFTP